MHRCRYWWGAAEKGVYLFWKIYRVHGHGRPTSETRTTGEELFDAGESPYGPRSAEGRNNKNYHTPQYNQYSFLLGTTTGSQLGIHQLHDYI